MSVKFPKLSLNYLSKRGFAAKTQAKVSAGSNEGLRQIKLPNGLIIAAIEDYSPISRIGVFVRAGSRFETIENLGITHCLRNACGLSTAKATIFGVTRNIEHVGGSLTATCSRDDLIYQLTSARDKISDNCRYLVDTVSRPAFKPWELKDFAYRMNVDNAKLAQMPEILLFEGLHKACFRGGLANSLYAPDHMISAFDHNMLMHYFNDNFVTNRMAVVGQGVDIDNLLEFVEKNFIMKTGETSAAEKSKFVASEVRMERNLPLCSAAVVTEGVSASNLKDVISLSLFQHLLGTGPRVKYTTGGSRLHQAVAKAAQETFLVSSLNVCYSETGIFGFTITGSPNEMHKLIKAAIAKMRDTAKNLKEDHLKLAKRMLKSSLEMTNEQNENIIEEMGTQALNFGKILDKNEIETMIEKINLTDFGTIAAKVMKGRGAIASIGKVHNVPYLEDLA